MCVPVSVISRESGPDHDQYYYSTTPERGKQALAGVHISFSIVTGESHSGYCTTAAKMYTNREMSCVKGTSIWWQVSLCACGGGLTQQN